MKSKYFLSLVPALLLVAMLATMSTESVYAQGRDPNAKARAIQNGESIDSENPGIVGSDIDCVGGIDSTADATSTQCYLLAEGTPTSQYKTEAVAVQEGSPSSCPSGAGFTSGEECFTTTFDASFFTAPGDFRFVIEFYADGELIDIAGVDFRNHTFLVIPESGIGAIALVASSLAAFGGYYLYSRSHKNPIPAT